MNKKGFTLAELLIVVAIIAVLVAIAVPVFTNQIEKSREATDIANARGAYAQVMAAANSEDTSSSLYDPSTKTYKVKIELTQTKPGWQRDDSITIGNVNSSEDKNTYWRNEPGNGGTCLVSYLYGDDKAVFDWKGYSDSKSVQQTKTNVQTSAADYLDILIKKLNTKESNGKTVAQNLLESNKDAKVSLSGDVPAYFKTDSSKITTMEAPANGGNGKTWINFTLDENGNVVRYNYAKNEYAYSTENGSESELTWIGNATIK